MDCPESPESVSLLIPVFEVRMPAVDPWMLGIGIRGNVWLRRLPEPSPARRPSGQGRVGNEQRGQQGGCGRFRHDSLSHVRSFRFPSVQMRIQGISVSPVRNPIRSPVFSAGPGRDRKTCGTWRRA